MANKKVQRKKETIISIKIEWIVIGILAVLLILSFLTLGFRKLPFNLSLPFKKSEYEVKGLKALSYEDIQKIVEDYINNELLNGEGTAKVVEVTDDDSSSYLYKVKVEYNGRNIESFVSKDGKWFFAERYEIVSTKQNAVDSNIPKNDKPDILLFTMSYCPYGNIAEDFVGPVYNLLRDKINFEPHYVIYSNYAANYNADWSEYCSDSSQKYCSMHGIQELNQNVRELCVWKYEKDKFWDFVYKANKDCNSSNIDSCWEGIAKNLGINIDKIKTCQANEANSLLAEEVRLNEQYGVSGSPTIFINGTKYSGSRNPESFKNSVCNAFNNIPNECSQTLESTGSQAQGSCN